MTERAPGQGATQDRRFAAFAALCAVAIAIMFIADTVAVPAEQRLGRAFLSVLLGATVIGVVWFLRRGFTPRILMVTGVMLMVLGVAAAIFLPDGLDAAVVLPLSGAVLALPAARGRTLMILLGVAFLASMVGETLGLFDGTITVPASGSGSSLAYLESAVMLAFVYALLWWVGDRWWRTDEQARLALSSQRQLLEVNERLLSSLDPQGVFDLIADSLKAVMAYDNLTIYRVDREAGLLRPVLARDRFAQLIIQSTFPLDRGVTGWVVAHGTAECLNNSLADPRAATIPGTPDEPEALIVVPLLVGGEVAGTLNVGRMGLEEAHFSAAEFELARLFAVQASIALRNADTLRAVETRAETDALTSLRNRGAFDDRLAALMADPGVQPLVLVMLDLDGFKHFNDVRGHPAGDALLQAAGRAITDSVREGDLCFRYGGDEFALLLPRTDEDAAAQIAERVRVAIAGIGRGDGTKVTASVGLGVAPRDAQSPSALVAATDTALYRAKGSGGNRVETWTRVRATSAGR